MQKNKETNKENLAAYSKPKTICLCASRRLAHFVRLTPSGCVRKALKKNNVSRDFLLLYAIAVTQASLRPAARRLAHFVRLTPSGCLLKAKNHLSLCSSEISSLRSLDSEWVLTQNQKPFVFVLLGD